MFNIESITARLESYCSDIKVVDNEICFSFNDVRMWLSVDTFTHSANLRAEVFDYGAHDDDEESCIYSGEELVNVMTANMYPYAFIWVDGATEFELTSEIASQYQLYEKGSARKAHDSHRNHVETLGVFGTDDDVVDCREEYLSMYDDIRFFIGGHRLNKEAVEEVIVPSILQMVINDMTL